jgi:MarR family transcriptional regulator for hemolysin
MNSSSHEPSSPGAATSHAALDAVVDRILQVVPRTMHRIRTEMRTAGTGSLTVPQLRALLFVRRNPGTGLTPLAEHLGMTAPGASGLVDRLVRAGLVDRTTDPDERRRIQLRLTSNGIEHVGRAHLLVRSRLSADLAHLSPVELARLAGALEVLAGLAPDDAGREA